MNRNLNPAVAAEKIRARYVEAPKTDLDTLRELDRRVHRPAATFAYIFGSVASLVMGAKGFLEGNDLFYKGMLYPTASRTVGNVDPREWISKLTSPSFVPSINDGYLVPQPIQYPSPQCEIVMPPQNIQPVCLLTGGQKESLTTEPFRR